MTECKAKHKATASLTYANVEEYIHQIKKGQGTLWPLSQLETSLPHKKHNQNNTDQLWEYHLGFRIHNSIKYRYLHSVEFAYSLGKILQVIPQSRLPKVGHGDYNG